MLIDTLGDNEALNGVFPLLAGPGSVTDRLRRAETYLQETVGGLRAPSSITAGVRMLQTLRDIRDRIPEDTQPLPALASALQDTGRRLQDAALPADERLGALERAQILRHLADREADGSSARIPDTVHLIKTDGGDSDLPLIPYLCYRSVLAHCRGYRVILHAPRLPRGPNWESLLPYMEPDIGIPPQTIGPHRLELAAHQSDVWRVASLLREGGFYFDWDLLLLRSPESLRDDVCVMALEGAVPGYREVVGVSAIGARPGSVFLECWLNGMPHAFRPGQYVAHSTILAHDIANQLPSLIRLLPHRAFYHPGWTEPAMRWLFDPEERLPEDALDAQLEGCVGMHLFASHANFQRWAGELTLADVREGRNNLSLLLRRHLP